MSDITKKDLQQNERELIYLLLNHKNSIRTSLDSGLSHKHFSKEHQPIVIAIFEVFNLNDALLTRRSFLDKSKGRGSPKDRISLEMSFNRCSKAVAKIDDLHLLIGKVKEDIAQRSINEMLDNFSKNFSSKSTTDAIGQLIDEAQNVMDGLSHGKSEVFYDSITALSKKRLQYIQDVRSGKIEEIPPVLTGFREIDYTMVTGLAPGTLTLFCADVGGFKSTMLQNIAINTWKDGRSVLYVPLEMPKEQMWDRITAAEARVRTDSIIRNIKDMPDDIFTKLEDTVKMQDERSTQLFIMERPGTTSVPDIQRQIEARIEVFNPDIIIVDYIGNLEAHKDRYGRNDLEIGDMLKSLRSVGKQHGFAVVSADQLGRTALQRLRKIGSSNDDSPVYSDDIRGSHEYSADADNIYALVKHVQQPTELLNLYAVKCRNGSTVFEDGKVRATLDIHPEMGWIHSPSTFEECGEDDDILGELVDKTEQEAAKKGTFFEADDDIFGSDDDTEDDGSDIPW